MSLLRVLGATLALVVLAACVPPSPPATTKLVAVGDLVCAPGAAITATTCHQADTAALVDAAKPQIVQTLGDHQYQTGQLPDFTSTYAATWGRFRAITQPAVGEHDGRLSNFSGFNTYFGAAAHASSDHYYSYTTPSGWHVVVLNTECDLVPGGCGAGSPQETWLRNDLAAHPAACTIAAAHDPRYSSGPKYSNNTATMGVFFADLVNAKVEMLLSGGDHDYERFAPQDNASNTTAAGVVQFVVGPGGASTTGLGPRKVNSVTGDGRTFGVLILTLRAGAAEFRFQPIAGSTYADAGTVTCH